MSNEQERRSSQSVRDTFKEMNSDDNDYNEQ